ncbi:biotin/acetyl-CoA-carboxylase ligase [Hyphomicrobium denitrificans 1NES1]|uniref:biotin--[biotin carboxyl-carrier protein] ligase n=1 Tax=Hyphomicrobium denitrificans 1NES1 TaxID=670307 RepID=N0BAA1_9HYPH|nr:biotin--[acetyl-CoA-carboxylase] ligase [Hyphomicrobium denitrificans]AGK57461.1 biotin/acetyl-CoA-carboxylase ligase [Hyphomicrobium denitrificans 1NES1]
MDASATPRILHIDETDSTNADAMRLALKGEDLPLWVIAGRQTAGRGRAGRSWVSPEGNLYTSIAFCCSAPMENAGQLSLIAGISLLEAIRASTDLAQDAPLRLKWPNDILMGAAKMGGILVESTSARGSPGFLAIVGFGLNLSSHPDDLGRTVTSLSRHAQAPTPTALLASLAEQFPRWLDIWRNGDDFAAVRRAWMERAGPIGEAMTVNSKDGPISGTYRGLAETGALLAEVDGQVREINHGDVALGGADAYDGDA